MKALRVRERRAYLDDIPVPTANGEALVRVMKSGICSTDLEIVRGYAGFTGTIGHEFVGVVEQCENDRRLIGKRVVGEINAGCGKCELCIARDPRHCPSRSVLGIHGRDGAHAEFLTLPARNLIEVPESVSDQSAVFAEPLAAAEGVCERVEITPETKVAVIGDGKLGLLCSMTARLRTDHVSIVGKHPEKMRVVEKLGVEAIPAAAAKPGGFDVVIEASGSSSGFATALDMVRPRGKIVLKSTFEGTPTWEAAKVVVNEISIIGSRCGRLAPAIELLASKKVIVEDLISDEQPLTSGVAALERAGQKGVLKILLVP